MPRQVHVRRPVGARRTGEECLDDASVLSSAPPWQLEPEPEPPDAEEKSRTDKFIDGLDKDRLGYRDHNEAKQEWLHGEILFEDTGTVTKFLLVPDHVEDPEEVLQVMLGDWGMPMPNMTISVQSADGEYFNPVSDRMEDWDTFPSVWGSSSSEVAAAAAALNGTCRQEGAKDHVAAQDQEDTAKEKFKGRMKDMMYGICRAATESKGWIVSEKCKRTGSETHGAIVDPGVKYFKRVRQSEARDLVNVAFAEKGRYIGSMPESFLSSRTKPSDREKMQKALALKIEVGKTAVTLDQTPTQQLVFPNLHEAGEVSTIVEEGTASVVLRNQCSHIIFSKTQQLNENLKILTEDLVPHVSVVVSGKKTPGTWKDACAKATRGAQIILLENSGKVVDEMVRTVENEISKRHGDQTSKGGRSSETVLDFPDSVKTSSFLIFDAESDSPDTVIEKLTSALATVGGDEMREMGFAQTEQQRLIYAWELVVLYRHNSTELERQARSLHVGIMMAAVLTTVCAVLLTASHEEPKEYNNYTVLDTVWFDEALTLDPGLQRALSLACSVVPMISAFLLAVAHKFSYTKRWAMMAVAAERVCSEIYLYRARVGEFQQRTKNAKLAALVEARKEMITTSTFNKADDKAKTEPKPPAKNSREVFSENLHELQSELMGSEVRMASLHKPPQEAKELLRETLYPFIDEQTQREQRTKRDAGEEYVEAGAISRSTNLLLEEGLSDFSLLGTAMEDDARDDGIGLISAHDYLRFRLLPAISRLNLEIPRHEKWYNSSQTLILLATMLASVFGVVGLHVWIPVVAATVAGVESIVHFDQTAARLVGANAALTQLKNLRLWWQSLSRTQQSLPQNKAQLIESSEDAIESELMAWTQGMLRKKRKVDAAEDEDDAAGGSSGGKKG